MDSSHEISKENFAALLAGLQAPKDLDVGFLFDCYQNAVEGAKSLKAETPLLEHVPLNPVQLTLYLANEHSFYLLTHPDKKQEAVVEDESYERFIVSVALDKYYTNEHLAYKNGSFASRFLPEISTISLYLNFVLGILSHYKKGDPKQTLVVDILQKGFSMAKCIVDLITDGFETEAFSTWRTLHENECILAVIMKYGQPAIDEYLKHMRYAMAFRGMLATKEETDAAFVSIKDEMHSIGLKSKDMKRFIEYGWLLGVKDVMAVEGFKFNFRDGVERVAGLKEYSKVYEMSSEIAHSSPLLIYSRKNYFYLVTMLNLYESFFRLEKVFSSIYMSTVPQADQDRYVAMRKLYYGELLAVYGLEKSRFVELTKSGKKDELPPKEDEVSAEDE